MPAYRSTAQALKSCLGAAPWDVLVARFCAELPWMCGGVDGESDMTDGKDRIRAFSFTLPRLNIV